MDITRAEFALKMADLLFLCCLHFHTPKEAAARINMMATKTPMMTGAEEPDESVKKSSEVIKHRTTQYLFKLDHSCA